ncbi:MAG: glycosyltransferase family 4 protein [Ruminococcaceae bacterium]|nr:glycosyltransferase family 4 protein [Oscillospiraceae bacterium]
MNILFMSLVRIGTLEERGLYTDLLREFVKEGHYVRLVSPVSGEPTRDIRRDTYGILQVETAPIQKMGLIKKGIATLQIAPKVKAALKAYCADERYDLILMATPPITLASVVEYVKKRDGAEVYLLLKDIWPQGIADLGAISVNGPVYRYFRGKEKRLYRISDRIGCMSPANVDYVRRHNPRLDGSIVELCPNSVEPVDTSLTAQRRAEVRAKYGIPQDRTVFVYGGNLGRPQGVPFLVDCLRACSACPDAFFVICGTGTEYPKLKSYVDAERPEHVLLLNGLPHDEYESLAAACDVGLIFLDYRFTIPNFPSRLLSYMQAGLPVICCTDPNTDIGAVAETGGFGWKCPSNDVSAFAACAETACRADRAAMGAAGRRFLLENYTARRGYEIITKKENA